MSTYYHAANRRHQREARAGLIPNGWTFHPGNLEDWAANQLGSLYEPEDAVALARTLREEGYAMSRRQGVEQGWIIQSDALPEPISSLLP